MDVTVREKDLGVPVAKWTEPPKPDAEVLQGRYASLERLSAERHATDLFRANSLDDVGEIWDYLPYGPFASQATYHRWLKDVAAIDDPHFLAIRDLATGHVCGVASYLNINPAHGSIEVGHINFAPELQRSRAATDAIYQMMKWAFEAGYRRFEWKCNALNLRSRRAAERFGLSYEGVFRQMMVVKGRNRDTAWFASIDSEWPALKVAYQTWLSPANFDADGGQIEALADLTRLVRATDDPALRGYVG